MIIMMYAFCALAYPFACLYGCVWSSSFAMIINSIDVSRCENSRQW